MNEMVMRVIDGSENNDDKSDRDSNSDRDRDN